MVGRIGLVVVVQRPDRAGRGLYRCAPPLERERTVFYRHLDHVARPEVAPEDPLRQRVLELVLDRALERPRTIHRVEAGLAEQVARRRVEFEADVAVAEALAQVA